MLLHKSKPISNHWLVVWEINVPFQHKNRLYQGQGLSGDLVLPG